MKPCEHSAWLHQPEGFVSCYWCGLITHSTWPTYTNSTSTPRDEVDAFISTLKGVAR